MIILKKKHDLVVENLERKIVDLNNIDTNRLMKIEQLQKDLKIELDTKNNFAEELESINRKYEELKKLHEQSIEENKRINWCIDECKKDNERAMKRLVANKIAKDQLRELCLFDKTETEVLIKEKVSGKRVYDLTMLIG